MILNSYIREQLAEAHRRDLMHTAQARQARQLSARPRRSVLRGRRRQTGLEPCPSVSRPCVATP